MHNQTKSYNSLPAFIVGSIEGIIIILALFCFMQARGTALSQVFLYTSIAMIFIAFLLYAGAYFTRKGELDSNESESRTLKIYKALDIDDNLKEAMVADTVEEKKNWEKVWQEGNNATSSLSPKIYALSVFAGFVSGGVLILLNNYIMELPDYKAILVPFVLLGFLGFTKYKLSNKNPLSGMLLISLSGIGAAIGAYYAGGLFN